MNSLTTSLIVFGSVAGAALIGMVLRATLPERYFSHEAGDVIRLGLGLISTMNAIVLGLLIATAKSSYDERRTQLTRMSADAILLDRSLALYGAETQDTRRALRELVGGSIAQIQFARGEQTNFDPPGSKVDSTAFYKMVRRLSPRDAGQRSLKAEALRISVEVAQSRALMLARERSSVPLPFVAVLVLWLAILFAGFGVFAPFNPGVLTALCICAFAVSAAIFLILEMDQPSVGIMQVSIEPLRNAMAQLGN